QASYWFHQAVEMDPTYAEPHYLLAVLCEKQHDISDALREYEITNKLQPIHVPARLAHGALLAKLDRYPEAIEEFQTVLRIDPQAELARHDLTGALERTGRFDEAAEQIRIL